MRTLDETLHEVFAEVGVGRTDAKARDRGPAICVRLDDGGPPRTFFSGWPLGRAV